MSAVWEVAVQGESLQFLLGLKTRERDLIFAFLQQLATDPYQPFDFREQAPSKREYRGKIVGSFTIFYWLDHFAKELRVMRIVRNRTR